MNAKESPATRATLLLRLRNHSDGDAWNEFVQNYGPMLYRFVRSRGLQDADASDLIQDVMRSVGSAIGRLDYSRQKGGFRAWLFTITRNKLYSFLEKRKRQQATGPTGNDTAQYQQLNQATDDDQLQDQWELEYQRQLMARAIEVIKPQVEPNTWAAFERTAIEGLSATDVSQELNMKPGTIYVARSRVTARLRKEIERLMAEEES